MMNERGAVLPITLSFVLAFTLLGFSTIYLSTVQNEAAEHRIASEKAFWLAEAGIQKALWEFNYNSCKGLVSKVSQTACTSCGSCGEKKFASVKDELETKEDAKKELKGDYDIELNSASSSVISTGSFPRRTSEPNRAQRAIKLTPNSNFNYALFAKDQIILKNGTTVDSYNSTLGSYGPGNQASNGHIGSNGTIPKGNDSAIFLQGPKIEIKGNVSTGPGGNITGTGLDEKDIDKIVTGQITHESNVVLEDVVVPNLNWNTQTDELKINKKNKSMTISGGNYQYSSIDVQNGGQLIIDGKVNIYLTKKGLGALKVEGKDSEVIINPNSSLRLYTDGEVKVSNNANINNLTKDPKQLTIYSTISNDKKNNTEGIDIWNDSAFYGAIYAPGSHVFIDNNSDVFGSFVARDFLIPIGVKLHYDESLAGKISDATAEWSEINVAVVQ